MTEKLQRENKESKKEIISAKLDILITIGE